MVRNGDDQDRTGNLLVANQAVCGDESSAHADQVNPALIPFVEISRISRDRGRWHWRSEVDHGAVDVGAPGRGEVQRDRRFLEGDDRTSGDVEAAA